MTKKSRGQIEADFTTAIIKFEKEYLGRGPLEARTFFIQDMILVRLQGILTPAELKLAKTREGQALVKETRRQLFETSRDLLAELVRLTVGCQLISLHTDMSTKTGERVVVLTVDEDLNKKFG
ncbi:MAG TPA: DUF2294 domain-containing protein [Anaerolineae bacterium]|nr:DUF2294 domain-containing protein [Anaerolineae bacterium]HMR63822.1 DUF2294 domain-containing protein [Anaerolineae bacterium]